MAPPQGWLYLIYSCLFWSVHGIVPDPQNVRISSINFDSILQWDPPNLQEENLTYTVQYQDIYSYQFSDLCSRIACTECNITKLPKLGDHIIRVRTESEKEKSKWVNISFEPLRDTTIGPPDVYVKSTSGVLYVEVTDPPITNIRDYSSLSIKGIYGSSMTYKMLIWKKDYDEQVRDENIMHNSIILSDLDPGTTYCLKVQVLIREMNKKGEWSNVFCHRTNDSGVNPVQLTVILLSVLVLLPFGCLLILHLYRRVKNAFLPSYSLPQHFKEFTVSCISVKWRRSFL
ncbi:interleukin-10 receptor subunit beta isoform X2 [Hemicordylus capensis]|uniref:interleukin-10 receptor subunit beta isoform X2 n=1 Tax=Hemicordylus capensis TaxID=884348 RepID=UPI002302A250|nr:interleukin-10 receptor subunit beta isoform X2 [Hemicordylus capensis]